MPWSQTTEQVNSAVVHQLIVQQQWTEGRPPQQWRIQNYDCQFITSLKKILSMARALNSKKRKKDSSSIRVRAEVRRSFITMTVRDIYELNRTSRFFPGHALPFITFHNLKTGTINQ